MKIFGMGGIELIIILVVILLIFGPKNLPKLGKAFGKTVSNLRDGMNEGKKKDGEEEVKPSDEDASEVAELTGEVEDAPVENKPAVEETSEVEEEAQPEAKEAEEEAVEEASEAPVATEAPRKVVRKVVRKKAVADELEEGPVHPFE